MKGEKLMKKVENMGKSQENPRKISISQMKKKIRKNFSPTNEFFRVLSEKNALKEGSIITISLPEDKFVDMYVENVFPKENCLAARTIDRNKYTLGDKLFRIYFSLIRRIDDMDLRRIAESLEIDEKGKPKEVKIDSLTGLPVRRGRKSKKMLELIEKIKKEKQKERERNAGRKHET